MSASKFHDTYWVIGRRYGGAMPHYVALKLGPRGQILLTTAVAAAQHFPSNDAALRRLNKMQLLGSRDVDVDALQVLLVEVSTEVKAV